MSSLEIGIRMFKGLQKLRTVYSALSGGIQYNLINLVNGEEMFANTNIEEVNINPNSTTYYYCLSADFPSLVNGCNMFNNCRYLKKFYVDMPSLVNATQMFSYNLISTFESQLGNLKTGAYMFIQPDGQGACPLTYTSIASIANNIQNITHLDKSLDSDWYYTYVTHNSESGQKPNGDYIINNYYDAAHSKYQITACIAPAFRGVIHLGSNSYNPSTDYDVLASVGTLMQKGWTVYVNQYKGEYDGYTPPSGDVGSGGGTPSLKPTYDITPSTYSLRNTESEENEEEIDETIAPTMYYYKSVEVPEPMATYIDQNNKYYIIIGAEFIYGDDLSNYNQYTSMEEAANDMGLTKYIRETE